MFLSNRVCCLSLLFVLVLLSAAASRNEFPNKSQSCRPTKYTLATKNFCIVSKNKKKKKNRKEEKKKKRKKLYQVGQGKKFKAIAESQSAEIETHYIHIYTHPCVHTPRTISKEVLYPSTANPSKCRNIFRIGFFLNHFIQIHEATAVELQNF